MTGKSLKKVLERALADPEFKREYDALEPEFKIKRELIERKRKLTPGKKK
jgi:hypothetical protein